MLAIAKMRSPILVLMTDFNTHQVSHFLQCVAEMLAARIVNEPAGNENIAIYGTVT